MDSAKCSRTWYVFDASRTCNGQLTTGTGHHIETSEEIVIKTEIASAKLDQEATVLQTLAGGIGFPTRVLLVRKLL